MGIIYISDTAQLLSSSSCCVVVFNQETVEGILYISYTFILEQIVVNAADTEHAQNRPSG